MEWISDNACSNSFMPTLILYSRPSVAAAMRTERYRKGAFWSTKASRGRAAKPLEATARRTGGGDSAKRTTEVARARQPKAPRLVDRSGDAYPRTAHDAGLAARC